MLNAMEDVKLGRKPGPQTDLILLKTSASYKLWGKFSQSLCKRVVV